MGWAGSKASSMDRIWLVVFRIIFFNPFLRCSSPLDTYQAVKGGAHNLRCHAMREAIELLTQCFVLVQGQTVSIMGSVKGIKQAGLKYQRYADMPTCLAFLVILWTVYLEIKIVLTWL